ncbi:cell division protein FtsB [Celerinatantimonas yamalensis]|uniref:Cell division protein FtsB n=1 Tax=Celerinatantimonas yamalensis TaxID=559956 RepID=A0ABW9G8P1_9GAMM
MRLLTLMLSALLLLLQYDLWFGKNSLTDYFQAKHEVAERMQDNQQLIQRNKVLKAEIDDLRTGDAAVEEHARNELGMIRQNETFYRFIQTPANKND